ncbi:MAG: ABC transporter permease [Promethearchaeota archaeon]
MSLGTWMRYTWHNVTHQKSRAFLGVVGVSISVFLLSCMLFLLDSASARYLEYSSQQSGNRDFVLTYTGPGSPFPSRSRSGRDPTNVDLESTFLGSRSGSRGGIPTSFTYANVTELLASSPDLGALSGYFPRTWTRALVNASGRSRGKSPFPLNVPIVGLNFSLEFGAGFGSVDVAPNGSTPEFERALKSGRVPTNTCIVLQRTAKLLGYLPGDPLTLNISVPLPSNATTNQTEEYWDTHYQVFSSEFPANHTAGVNVTLGAVVTTSYKFAAGFKNGILFDLGFLQEILNQSGRATHLVCVVGDPYGVYDFSNVDGTRANLLAIAEDIQRAVGFPYEIDTPKLASLEETQFLSGGFSVLAWFIFAVSGLVAAILIHGILTTGVEERIREFGLLRTLGGRKSLSVKLVFLESTWFYVVGTAVGMAFAYLTVRFVVIGFLLPRVVPPAIRGLGFTMVVRPFSIIAPFVVGVGFSLLVALFPAMKVRRLSIVEAIHPYRHEDKLFKLKARGAVNWRLVVVGAVFAVNGSLLFFLIPHLAVTLNIIGLVAFFASILLSFLFGLALVAVGFIPAIQSALGRASGFFTRKKAEIIKVNVRRHRRRNFNTSLTFCLTFAFIAFLSTALYVVDQEMTSVEKRDLGADIVVEGASWWTYSKPLSEEFEQEVSEIEGIERAAPVYLLGNDKADPVYVSLSDFVSPASTIVTLVSVDPTYVDATFSEYLSIDPTKMPAGWNASDPGALEALGAAQLTTEHPLAPLFAGNDTCMVSESIAKSKGLAPGDFVRLNFEDAASGGKTSVRFEVVGIVQSFPGFPEFRKLPIQASGSGVLVGPSAYRKYVGLSSPLLLDRLAIKVRDDQRDNATAIARRIETELGADWGIWAETPYEEGFLGVDASVFLTLINLFGVGFAMFGLLSTANSIIVERKKEFAIYRTLGLRKWGMFEVVYLEILITLTSAVVAGSLAGWAVAVLLVSQVNLFLQVPTPFGFPWATILSSWGTGAFLLFVSLLLLMRKVQKPKIMEVFRQTAI